MTNTVASTSEPRSPAYVEELAELARVIVVTGLVVGAVVAGLGSRLAMLLLRVTSPGYVRGVESDDGFTIGQVTLGGTYNLVVIGAAAGVIGAAAYAAVAPWLIGPIWFRRATVGATAGALVGSMLVHSDGIDFTVLEPRWLAVSLFVLLPALVGVAIAAVADMVAAPDSWTAQGRARWAVPAVLAAVVAPALVVIVPVLVVVAVLLPVRRALLQPLQDSAVGRTAVRAGFALVPIMGGVALAQDLGELY
jgi:hypothetical protein